MRASRLIRIVLATGLAAEVAPTLARQLPAPRAPTPPLEFTGPEAGWPSQVKGVANVRILPMEPVPEALTPACAVRVGEVAATSPIVRRVLGDRFAFIEADLLSGDRREDQPPPEQRLTHVTFYSYSGNVAVRALVRGGEVLEVVDVQTRNYQSNGASRTG